MSDHTQFSISFDGPALENHSMDVRDLGRAMLSLGTLFDEANETLNGGRTQIKVHVKAQTAGSFEVAFELIQSLMSQVSDFLNHDLVTSASSLRGWVFGGGGVLGVLQVLKKLRGGRPLSIKDIGNDMVAITIDGETIEVHKETLKLYRNLDVLAALRDVVQPLEREGLNSIQIKHGDEIVETIYSEDLECFVVPEAVEVEVADWESVRAFSIDTLAFKSGSKWRLNDGSAAVSVTISDKDFLAKVDGNRISFLSGDILKCHVRTIQVQTEKGLRNVNEVLEVLEHIKPQRQQSLPFDAEPKEAEEGGEDEGA